MIELLKNCPYNLLPMEIYLDPTEFAAVILFEMQHEKIFNPVPKNLSTLQQVLLQKMTFKYLTEHQSYKDDFMHLLARLHQQGAGLGKKMIESRSIYI